MSLGEVNLVVALDLLKESKEILPVDVPHFDVVLYGKIIVKAETLPLAELQILVEEEVVVLLVEKLLSGRLHTTITDGGRRVESLWLACWIRREVADANWWLLECRLVEHLLFLMERESI